MAFKPMAHQDVSIKFLKSRKEVFDQSDAGCVSADTEFLTPTGWKRIDQYTKGDLVAQFHPDTKEIEFVKPISYVKKPCNKMIAIAPVRGTSQRLSPEHRVLYYKRDGSWDVKSAYEFMQDHRARNPHHNDAKFCTTFSVKTSNQLELSEFQIRLMVAVIADGYFASKTSNRCVIRLKKRRKISRLQELLIKSKTEYCIHHCNGVDKAFRVFKFYAPRNEKEFGEYWWGASQAQLEIIADELCYWDSSEDKRKSNATRFSSFNENSANFAQYAFSAAKRPAALSFSVRNREAEGRGVMVEYNVHARESDQLVGAGRSDSVFEIENPEGFKYCFEVPTTFLLFRHNGYIFASGNTGKTLVEIMDFVQRHKKDKKCLLVLCPKSLMRAAWYNDIGKFAPHLRVSLCYANKRKESLEADADVYVVNVDGVKDLVKITNKVFWKKFGTLVIDESDAFMHDTSQRSKAAVKVRQHFEYVRLLSATPQGNTICDQWHQYFILDKGKRLGKSFYGFRSACCTPEQTGPKAAHLTWTDKPGIELAVAELVRDITIRHKFEDCVDIPPIHTYTMSFPLDKKHMAAYNEMKNDQLMVIKDEVVTAINAAVVAQKLLQIASGAVYDGNGKYVKVANERYELVLDLVCDRPYSVVFYTWEHQLEELVAEAKKRKISWVVWDPDTPEIADDFQAGKYKVIFAHPASAAHGLTLTKATAVIWASPTFNVRHFIQGTKRIHRIGQKQKTENIVVIAEDTADEKAYESMLRKEVNLIKFLSELE